LFRAFVNISISCFTNGTWMTLIVLIFVNYCMSLRWIVKCLVLEWYIGLMAILM
jgi:hypothetical protein